MSKKLRSKITLLLISAVVTLFYFFVASESPFFKPMRLRTMDILFNLRAEYSPPLKSLKKLIIIGVDDDSFRLMNRNWPWGREIFAVFLENLQKLNPKVVGFDFTFIGKSPNQQIDEWLADAVGQKKNVILASYFDTNNNYLKPLETISNQALGCGFIEKPIDDDGVTRKTRAVMNQGGVDYFSFAAWISQAYLDRRPSEALQSSGNKILVTYPNGEDGPAATKYSLPTDSKGCFWESDRYKPKSFLYLPFWRVAAGQVPQSDVEGKIVIVGPIAAILHDVHETPLGVIPGTCLVANEVLMFLDHDFLKEIPWIYWGAILLVLALALTFVFDATGFVARFVILVVMEILIYGLCVLLFIKANFMSELFSLMFIVAITYLAVSLYKGFSTFMENLALQRLVIIDTLTGLYGYRYLTIRLESEFNKSDREKKIFHVAMIDVDFFKNVNDRYGHEQGNVVLSAIAKLLKSGVRGYDVAARYGGEEFMLVLFHHDEKEVFQTIERIRLSVEKQVFHAEAADFHVTISAGICANTHPDVHSKDDLIRCADAALYQAKSEGRNRVYTYKAKSGGRNQVRKDKENT